MPQMTAPLTAPVALPRPRQAHYAWVVGILVVAALLRFGALGSKSLWFDEAFSVAQAGLPQERIWTTNAVRAETHPPLYYSGLALWVGAFGDSETSVRLPSALVSTLNVGLLYLLARRLAGREAALVAAALLAVSPLNVWYAQEARMYVFMAAIALLLALALTWESGWALPALVAILLAGLYLDYTLLPIWTAVSAGWLVWWWRHGRSRRPLLIWLLGSLAAWLLYQPWLPTFYAALGTFNTVHLFIRLQEATGLPILAPQQYLLVMLVGGVLATGVFIAAAHLLDQPRWRRLLAPLILAGFALLTLLFPLPRLYGFKRLLVQVWPLAILIVAWLLVRTYPRWRRLAQGLFALSLLASLVALLLVPKDDWRGAVAYINRHAEPGAVTWLDPFFNLVVYEYYDPALPGFHARLARLAEKATGSIWLIAERFPGQPPPSSPAERWLDEHRRLITAVPFYRLEVRHYEAGAP